jgi:hypothetical protein
MITPQSIYNDIVRYYIKGGEISPEGRALLKKQQVLLKLSSKQAEEIEEKALQAFRAENTPFALDLSPTEDAHDEIASLAKLLMSDEEDLVISQAPASPVRPSVEPSPMGDDPNTYQSRINQYAEEFSQVIRMEFPPGEILQQGLQQLRQTLQLQPHDVEPIEQQLSQSFQHEQQLYQSKLQIYEQAFREAIAAEFPITPATQNRLWRFQRTLNLRHEDIVQIERQLLAQRSNDNPFQLPTPEVYQPEPASAPDVTEAEGQPLFEDAIDTLATPLPDLIHLPPEAPVSVSPPEPPVAADADTTQFPAPEPSEPDEPVTQLPYTGFTDADVDDALLALDETSDSDAQVSTTLIESPLSSERGIDYATLENLLQQGQWREADEETLAVMLEATSRERQGWLDEKAIAHFPATDLLTIDRLWDRYSSGRFSFRRQWQIYQDVQLAQGKGSKANVTRFQAERALEFSKRVGWWLPRLEFLKYYDLLDFSHEAPEGHLPACWFWTIPWQQALRCGGIGPGRGGCSVDAPLVAALMKRLQDCGFSESP